MCARTCKGNKQILLEKWNSLVYHIINIHRWNDAATYHSCNHGEPTEDQNIKRTWLTIDTTAFYRLKDIVQNKSLVRDLPQISQFCHTEELEVYHSIALKYLPKQNDFFMDTMIARLQLAALAYNHNVHHVQAMVEKATSASAAIWEPRHNSLQQGQA